MENPWRSLPGRAPFVLEEELEIIEEFNAKLKPNQQDKYHIHLNIIPEPYLGRPDAPVVLLNLNPGFSESDVAWHTEDPQFKRKVWANLLHEQASYHFYLLHPELERTQGYDLWNKRLRELMRDFGKVNGQKIVAENLLNIEYFPYHSKKYKALPHDQILDSQKYSFHLVREAIQRKAIIILLRSVNLWEEAIPELIGYEKRFELNSKQAPYVSPGNCPTPEHYQMVLDALKADNTTIR